MPTVLTHAAVPLAVGLGLGTRIISPRLLAAGVVASMLPDIDTIGFRYGVAYGSQFGHRGFTHSLAFAFAVACVAALAQVTLRAERRFAFFFVLLSTASHGLLDTLTTGGRGVALLWPLTLKRFFAPVRPIQVSPIGFTHRLYESIGALAVSELTWVWLPMAMLCALLLATRLRTNRQRAM